MFTSDLAKIFTSASTNMFNSPSVNMFTSDLANMFTSDLANMFTSDLANMFTSKLEKCKKLIWPTCSLVKVTGDYVGLVPGIRHLIHIPEGRTLSSKTVFGNWKLFKNDEKCFLCHVKSSFRPQDI